MSIPWLSLLTICLLQIHIPSVYGSASYDGSIKNTEAFTTCSKGWFAFGDLCYKMGGKQKIGRLNWENARQACKEEHNGDLATIYSKEIQDFLSALLMVPTESSVWVGLHDRGNETDYKWADGTPFNFTYFEPNEPSGLANEEEDCIEMVYKTLRTHGKMGQWNDIRCNNEFQFLCQKAKGRRDSKTELDPRFCTTNLGIGWRFEKSCFHVVPVKKNWIEAEDYCAKELKGHLATMDYRVNYFLNYVLRDVVEEMWIGVKIKEETQQKWSSGWLVSFENWAIQEKYEDGTCVSRHADGSWVIQPCKKELWFLCEYSTAIPPVLESRVENVHCPDVPKGWRDLGGDFCYFFDFDASVSWYEANFNCMRKGGTLASFHSEEELKVLFPFVRYYWMYRFYIGLYRHQKYEEEFAWADGSKLDFTFWDSGEPSLEKEQCGELKSESMKWNDGRCFEKKGYICSTPKVAPNSSTAEIPLTEACKNSISINSLLGVIACVLVVSILFGVVLYHFKFCDRGYDRAKKLSGTKMLTPSGQEKKQQRYRSEIVVSEDADYDNIA